MDISVFVNYDTFTNFILLCYSIYYAHCNLEDYICTVQPVSAWNLCVSRFSLRCIILQNSCRKIGEGSLEFYGWYHPRIPSRKENTPNISKAMTIISRTNNFLRILSGNLLAYFTPISAMGTAVTARIVHPTRST